MKSASGLTWGSSDELVLVAVLPECLPVGLPPADSVDLLLASARAAKQEPRHKRDDRTPGLPYEEVGGLSSSDSLPAIRLYNGRARTTSGRCDTATRR